ncbi:MAG: sulfur carrier protein ThiS [Pyrinomonadaceae bacterium]|nr:sulfur carrier protein ThiS [Pyrinomonadaceae bacterium]
MILVTINGERRELSNQFTLTQLLQKLELPLERIAVELNHDVVSRQNWETTKINDGDKLEIVHFVGGGTAF